MRALMGGSGESLAHTSFVDQDTQPALRCILRMGSSRTLPVVDSLCEAGFDVWSPREVVHRRMARSRRNIDRSEPIMPSFAFAEARQINALVGLSRSPLSSHPSFSVFRHLNGYPLISNRSLDGLRRLEESRKRRQALKEKSRFEKGDKVRATSGGFEGLCGVVDSTKGQYATVSFAGWNQQIQIASFLLIENVQ